ncbi:helix-turn-helix domain-containing protein [Streptomyces phaeochromogenes]|uniref:helix-turn-helix domain-containing protein n=1 Tax=Streptomyces phaeochromogenes TaxID=1923 RepID=UPI0037210118
MGDHGHSAPQQPSQQTPPDTSHDTPSDTPRPTPQEPRNAAEFAARLRRLKDRSGLSYRQLEERAADRGEVLPRSTLADVLRHDALPRPEMLAAFLNACGAGREAEAWLAARNRIAETELSGTRPEQEHEQAHEDEEERAHAHVQVPAPGGGPTGPQDASAPDSKSGPPPRHRRLRSLIGSRRRLSGAVLTLLVLAGGGYLASAAGKDTDDDGRKPGGPNATSAGNAASEDTADGGGASPVPGTYQIRSLTSSLCISERDGEETGSVYQFDCARGLLTYALEDQGDGVYRIRSLHPVFGYGCLGVTGGSTRGGAQLADDYCGHRGNAERFRLKPVATDGSQGSRGPRGPRGYRIMPLHTGSCVSVPGGSKKSWTPVLQLPCGQGESGQTFRFDPVPSPSAVPSISSKDG